MFGYSNYILCYKYALISLFMFIHYKHYSFSPYLAKALPRPTIHILLGGYSVIKNIRQSTLFLT